MDQPTLSSDSHVALLLTSHIGAPADTDDTGLGPAGWQEFQSNVGESSLESVGALLDRDKAEWPNQIWTKQAGREWVAKRLKQATSLAIELEDLNNAGIWVTTQYEESYPSELCETLGRKAPPFLFVAGDVENFSPVGVGFVGSRDADQTDKAHTKTLVKKAVQDGHSIVSGGAKGIDETSESEGLSQGGPVIEFPAEGLKNCLQDGTVRSAVTEGKLTLASWYHPDASWSVGGAMGRNKLIHALPEYTIVVRSGDEDGGTWAGATENLSNEWSTLAVCSHAEQATGNQKLIEKGGVPIDPRSIPDDDSLKTWIDNQSEHTTTSEAGTESAETDTQTSSETASTDEEQSSLGDF